MLKQAANLTYIFNYFTFEQFCLNDKLLNGNAFLCPYFKYVVGEDKFRGINMGEMGNLIILLSIYSVTLESRDEQG